MSDYRVIYFDSEIGDSVEQVFTDKDCLIEAVLAARWLVWAGRDVVQIQRTSDNAPIYEHFTQGARDHLVLDVPEWIQNTPELNVWMTNQGMPSPSNELWQHNVDAYFIQLAMQAQEDFDSEN